MRRNANAWICSAAALLAWTALRANALQDAPPSETPTAEDSGESAPDRSSQPTLDELLGLDEEEAQDDAEELLPDALDEIEQERMPQEGVSALFLEVIRNMSLSAARLRDQRDAGLATQRMQEEALKQLETLIRQAQQNQSSSNSQQQQQQQQQQDQAPQQTGQDQQQGQSRQGNNAGETMAPPARRDAELNGVLEERGREWGSLPARVRDMLMQGQSETVSSRYRELTEQYYRRLAEEAEP